ncbi:hypothetical protein NHQ30_001035 [Ciborinia camelliae]|nr:hypothetical protein NHQ30_001035 [Ciborinia camelliae]
MSEGQEMRKGKGTAPAPAPAPATRKSDGDVPVPNHRGEHSQSSFLSRIGASATGLGKDFLAAEGAGGTGEGLRNDVASLMAGKGGESARSRTHGRGQFFAGVPGLREPDVGSDGGIREGDGDQKSRQCAFCTDQLQSEKEFTSFLDRAPSLTPAHHSGYGYGYRPGSRGFPLSSGFVESSSSFSVTRKNLASPELKSPITGIKDDVRRREKENASVMQKIGGNRSEWDDVPKAYRTSSLGDAGTGIEVKGKNTSMHGFGDTSKRENAHLSFNSMPGGQDTQLFEWDNEWDNEWDSSISVSSVQRSRSLQSENGRIGRRLNQTRRSFPFLYDPPSCVRKNPPSEPDVYPHDFHVQTRCDTPMGIREQKLRDGDAVRELLSKPETCVWNREAMASEFETGRSTITGRPETWWDYEWGLNGSQMEKIEEITKDLWFPGAPVCGKPRADHPFRLIPSFGEEEGGRWRGGERDGWKRDWEGVLYRYADEVWGELLPLVDEAKNEIEREKEEEMEDGNKRGKSIALRRLGVVLGHLRVRSNGGRLRSMGGSIG